MVRTLDEWVVGEDAVVGCTGDEDRIGVRGVCVEDDFSCEG